MAADTKHTRSCFVDRVHAQRIDPCNAYRHSTATCRCQKSHEGPGACEVKDGLTALQLHLLQIEPIAFNDGGNPRAPSLGHHKSVGVVEHRRMNVGQPGHEPVCRKRQQPFGWRNPPDFFVPVSYTHLRAHETDSYLVCRLLLEKKKI